MTEIRKSYAFVLPWSIDHLGGVNQVVQNLIEEFRVGGEYHPVLIESHWPSVQPVIEQRPHFTYIRVRLRQPLRQPWGNMGVKALLAFLLSLPFQLWILARLAAVYRIEAFNIHFPGLGALCWITLRKLRLFPGQVILSFHGSDIRSAHKLRGWPRMAYRYLLRQADAVVSCSNGLQSEVLALEPRIKTHVIYNGIDERRFVQSAAMQSAFPPEVQQNELILNIGRYEYRKGHDLLLRAFAHVREKRPGVQLVIIGASGPELEKTKALVKDAGLAAHVTLYHDLPHTAIPGLLESADLFVLSSRWVPGEIGEGFPVAILEAAVAGKPVVTTRTCGAAEIIDDGVTGLLVPLDDANTLAEAMYELLENHERARMLAENLRRKVRKEFTWQLAYRAYEGLLKESAQRPS